MTKPKTHRFDTLSLHAGAVPDPATGARATPIYQSASFVFPDSDHAAANVRCPTLVVLGQRDLMAPAKNAAALCEALAGVRVVTLAGAGHAMMAEQPDAVLDALRAFL